MLRRFLAPLHPDGFKFVAAGVVATLLLFLVWAPTGWTAAVVTLWMVYFFRDPWRVTPIRPGLLISPADGIVVSIAAATNLNPSGWSGARNRRSTVVDQLPSRRQAASSPPTISSSAAIPGRSGVSLKPVTV